ncbi:MAG: hypothetical protein AAGF23_10295 [Acidobacteriota bacterium]
MKLNNLNRQAVRSNNSVERVTSLSDQDLKNVVGGQPSLGVEFFCVDEGGLRCIIYVMF